MILQCKSIKSMSLIPDDRLLAVSSKWRWTEPDVASVCFFFEEMKSGSCGVAFYCHPQLLLLKKVN